MEKVTDTEKDQLVLEYDRELKRIINVLEMVIDHIPQYIFWKDSNFIFQGCNKKFAKALNLKNPAEIVGKSDYDVSPKHAEQYRKIDETIMQTGKPLLNLRQKHICTDNKVKYFTVNKLPLKDDNNKVIGILGTCEDITNKVKLEEKIKKSEEKYRGLIEFTNTSYVIMDKQMNIIDANKNFIKIFGYNKLSQITGKKLRSWVMCQDIENFDVAFDDLLRGKNINDMEICFITDTKKVIYAIINASIVLNGDQKIMCLFRNISHRKTGEEQKYIEAQKKKDRIIQNINKIRNSLNHLS